MKLDTLKNAPVSPTNPFICVDQLCQKLLVGLKADLKNDATTIEKLARINEVR